MLLCKPEYVVVQLWASAQDAAAQQGLTLEVYDAGFMIIKGKTCIYSAQRLDVILAFLEGMRGSTS